MKILKKPGGKYLKEIYDDIEDKIINNKLNNNKQDICNYILEKY